MKFCTKCGKELLDEAVICTGCGCSMEAPKKEAPKVSYEDTVKSAVATNIVSGILLGLGIVVGWFLSALIGVVLCLAAELVALIPNTKLQKAIKANNYPITDKKQFKATAKAATKEVKAKSAAFKGSFIIAYIALAFGILCVLFI